MSMHVVTFRVNLNESQFARLLSALKPTLPDANRLESWIKSRKTISRVELMRHGKFTAQEIDLSLKAIADFVGIEGSGVKTIYKWKEK